MISANKKMPMQSTRALLRHSINLAKELPALEVTMLIPFNRCILMNRLVHHIFSSVDAFVMTVSDVDGTQTRNMR